MYVNAQIKRGQGYANDSDYCRDCSAYTLEEGLCRYPYEDLVIEYHVRPAGTTDAGPESMIPNLK